MTILAIETQYSNALHTFQRKTSKTTPLDIQHQFNTLTMSVRLNNIKDNNAKRCVLAIAEKVWLEYAEIEVVYAVY
jgi:hypothetical protein